MLALSKSKSCSNCSSKIDTVTKPTMSNCKRIIRQQRPNEKNVEKNVRTVAGAKPGQGGLICTPATSDVLCGKEKSFLWHPGNRAFKRTIIEFQEQYAAETGKLARAKIVKKVIDTMKEKYSTRFIRPQEGQWEEISATMVRDKISHAFRFHSQQRNRRKIDSRKLQNATIGSSEKSESNSSSSSPHTNPSKYLSSTALIKASPTDNAMSDGMWKHQRRGSDEIDVAFEAAFDWRDNFRCASSMVHQELILLDSTRRYSLLPQAYVMTAAQFMYLNLPFDVETRTKGPEESGSNGTSSKWRDCQHDIDLEPIDFHSIDWSVRA